MSLNLSLLLSSLIVPFGALLMVLMCGVVGYEVLRIFGMPGKNQRSENLSLVIPWISILFGSVIVALFLYASALFELMSRPVILTFFGVQVLLSCYCRGFWFTFSESIQVFVTDMKASSRWTTLLWSSALMIYLVFVFFGLCRAIVPTLEADSATFYLNAANLYLQYQSIINVGNVISSMGRTGFLHLVYGMGLFSSNLAQAFLFALSSVGFLLLSLFIGRVAGYAVAAFGFVVLMTSSYALHPIILEAKFDGYTFALTSVVLILLFFMVQGEKKIWVVIALGTVAGFLGGITYNNLFVAGFAGIICLWLCALHKPVRNHLIIVVLLAGIIGSAPTYIHNIVLFGNPVYPFAGKLFGSGHGTTIPEDSYNYYYMGTMKNDNVAKNVKEVLELPLRLFIRDSDDLSYGQREWVPGMSTQRDPWLGSLILLAMAGGSVIGGGWLYRRKLQQLIGMDTPLLYVGIICVGFWTAYVFWALNQHLFRYFSAGLPLAIVAYGYASKLSWHLIKPSFTRLLRPVFASLMMLAIVFMVWDWLDTVRMRLHPVSYWVFNGQTEEEYVAEHFSYCPDCYFGRAMIQLRPKLEPGDKVLSFATGLYYFGSEIKAFSGNGSATVPSPHALKKPLSRFYDWREWEQHIIEQDFRYLVINPTLLYLSDAEKPIIRDFLTNRTPEFTVGTTRIYRLQ